MEKFKNTAEDPAMNHDQPLTLKDLIDFKKQLVADLRKIIKEYGGVPDHQWLKAIDIKKMLRLSDGKLQYLRDRGIIPFKKLGGVTYYNLVEIQELMNSGKLSAHL